jgi:hypothetical protein
MFAVHRISFGGDADGEAEKTIACWIGVVVSRKSGKLAQAGMVVVVMEHGGRLGGRWRKRQPSVW